MRPNAWIRDVIYRYLEMALPSAVYTAAKDKDYVAYREAIEVRMQRRSKNIAEQKLNKT